MRLIAATIHPGRLFVGGKREDPISGRSIPSINPATEDVVTQITEASAEDVDRAVQAAQKAFDECPWPRMSGTERGRIL